MRCIFFQIMAITIFTITTSFAVETNPFHSSIYTDDSHYFLEINQDGFKQKVNIGEKYCSLISSLSLKFKKNTNAIISYKKLTNKNSWKKLYGKKTIKTCAYELKATGLDLNSPEKNFYVIQIHLHSGKTISIEAMQDSILMENRISTSTIKNWMSLGQSGATLVNGGGVFYKIWEPVAEEVHLFINNSTQKILLKSDNIKSPLTHHSVFIKSSSEKDKYLYRFIKNGKYELLETANNDIYSDIKVDPMARAITYKAKGGKHNGYIEPKAIVSRPPTYLFANDSKITTLSNKERDNWIIYQLWPLTFNPKKKNGKYVSGTFNDVSEKIPYLSDLGITSVEFLPIHESRFYASWGYAMDSIQMLDKAYGSPAQFQTLVDKFHKKKIRVILDVVLNHINNHLIRDPLDKKNTVSKYYKGDTGWGPKPRFEYSQVRKWIYDSLIGLMRDYHIDGFRFDMVEHIYINNSHGRKFLQELNTFFKRENADFYSSAEQLPDDVWATYPISQDGLAFDSQWNDKFKNFFELEFDHYREGNRNLDIFPLVGSLKGYSNHRVNNDEQHFGAASRTVNYLGSHDVVGNKNPILRMASNHEAYEWEGNNHFFRVKPLESTDNPIPGFRQIHNYFTHSLGRSAYGTLFTKPGASLFFQGEELASDINIENEWSYINAKEGNTIPTQNVDIHRYIKSHKVQWEYLNPRKHNELNFLSDEEVNLFTGYHKFFKELVHFRKLHPEFNDSDASEVKTHFNNNAVSRKLGKGKKEYFVILNLGEKVTKEWINFPGNSKDWWKEVYNSNLKKYGHESNKYQNIISNVGGRNNHIRIDGTSFILFEKDPQGTVSKSLYLRGNFNTWSANPKHMLNKASDHGDIYIVNFDIKESKKYEFKLGTKDWDIDIGLAPAELFFQDPKELTVGKGYLSYIPGLQNIEILLDKGSYKFIFNIRTFKYNIIKTK